MFSVRMCRAMNDLALGSDLAMSVVVSSASSRRSALRSYFDTAYSFSATEAACSMCIERRPHRSATYSITSLQPRAVYEPSDMVCTTCRNILFRSDPEEPGPNEEPMMQWGQLQKNAMCGCISCQIICSTVLAGTPPQSVIQPVDVWQDEFGTCINVSYLQAGGAINQLDRLYPFAQRGRPPLSACFRTCHKLMMSRETPWPTIATSQHTSFVPTELETATKLIQDWLKACDEGHECFKSKTNQGTSLPTRVLDVGSRNRSPHLHASHGQQGRYAALSHCWGLRRPNIKRLSTTTDKFEAFQGSIEYGALPATFRDAVDICRNLGLRYLWIDSLCILQDSEQDWHTESSRMKDVYQNAYITIAADLAPHSDFGLFRKDAQVQTREFTQRHSDGSTHQIYIRRNWPVPGKEGTTSRSCYASEASSCLSSRGWVLQERLLSARIVHFTSSELQWECPQSFVCSCGMPVEKRSPKTFFDRALSCSSHGEGPNGAPVPELWHTVVKNFTLRRLTYAVDRLPAISGIAAAMPYSSADYCAGLWKRTILYDLTFYNPFGHETWKVVAGDRTLASKYSVEYPSARTEEQPSWSWTSITGPVKFGARSSKDFALEWQLEEVKCTPSTANPFGPVASNSFLRVFGYLFPVTIEERHSSVLREEFPDGTLHTSIEMCVVRSDNMYPGRNKTWFDIDLDGCEWQDTSCRYYVLIAGTQTVDGIPLALIVKAKAAHDDLSRSGLHLGTSCAASNGVHEQDATSISRGKSDSQESILRKSGQYTTCDDGGGPANKRKNSGVPEIDESVVDSSNWASDDALASMNSTAHSESFTRIGLVRLDNWRGCEWRSGSIRRSIRII